MARGLVTPERTTLIASAHREFTIGERSAMGQAAATEVELVEIARAQRLLKGYGDTHERGWRNFASLREQLAELQNRADGAIVLARLQEAARAADIGSASASELGAMGSSATLTNYPAPRFRPASTRV
jgi:hypothetical protein